MTLTYCNKLLLYKYLVQVASSLPKLTNCIGLHNLINLLRANHLWRASDSQTALVKSKWLTCYIHSYILNVTKLSFVWKTQFSYTCDICTSAHHKPGTHVELTTDVLQSVSIIRKFINRNLKILFACIPCISPPTNDKRYSVINPLRSKCRTIVALW